MDTEQPSERDQLAQGVGQVIGELLGAFVAVINVLRKQPGFNEDAFRSEIGALTQHPSTTKLQQHTYELLLHENALQTPQAPQ